MSPSRQYDYDRNNQQRASNTPNTGALAKVISFDAAKMTMDAGRSGLRTPGRVGAGGGGSIQVRH